VISEEEVREALGRVRAKGIESIAVVFLHSYTFPLHESIVKQIAAQMFVSLLLDYFSILFIYFWLHCLIICFSL
jgi:N-methylhydantoinase A/oxoprolinase/acetone carboxylase beta subunit